jgi:hypothetical protein
MQTDQVFLQILVMGSVVVAMACFATWLDLRQSKEDDSDT